MCHCNPLIRTPHCGKPDCVPKERKAPPGLREWQPPRCEWCKHFNAHKEPGIWHGFCDKYDWRVRMGDTCDDWERKK